MLYRTKLYILYYSILYYQHIYNVIVYYIYYTKQYIMNPGQR